ncbi:MAG: vitamin K epoxide reductase family protein [Luteolibacter sp.]
MTHLSRQERIARGGFSREWVFRFLVFAGFAINLYLLFQHIAGGGIAGCAGGPCEEMLTSRWSVVFGVPVTVFGTLVYGGLMVSPKWWGRRFTVPLLGVILGSVFWSLFVQGVLIGKFCPWCLAAHGVGLAVVCVSVVRSPGNLVRWSAGAFLAIGLMQVYGPVPPTYQIDGDPVPGAGQPVQASGNGRKVSFDGGRKSFAVAALPRLGSADARHVMVEYFDYQCASCRIMAGYLSALVDHYPADICVLLMPVPLDPVCNDSFLPGDVGHPDSCELARIALAVWREKPEAFSEFHRAVLSRSALTVPDVLSLARQQVTRARLDVAMEDPWIDELIAANIADWVSFSGKTKQLPKLLIRDKRVLHGLPSGEADFIRAVEQELGLRH